MQTLGLTREHKSQSWWKNVFWTDLVTEADALSACQAAATVCFVVAVITCVFGLLTNPWILIDAAVFAGIGLGLRFKLRSAAIAGFLIYLLEQGYALTQGRFPGFLSIFFIAILFNGVRAAFMYPRLKSAQPPPAMPSVEN